jgi:uncharacterized protein YpbB
MFIFQRLAFVTIAESATSFETSIMKLKEKVHLIAVQVAIVVASSVQTKFVVALHSFIAITVSGTGFQNVSIHFLVCIRLSLL